MSAIPDPPTSPKRRETKALPTRRTCFDQRSSCAGISGCGWVPDTRRSSSSYTSSVRARERAGTTRAQPRAPTPNLRPAYTNSQSRSSRPLRRSESPEPTRADPQPASISPPESSACRSYATDRRSRACRPAHSRSPKPVPPAVTALTRERQPASFRPNGRRRERATRVRSTPRLPRARLRFGLGPRRALDVAAGTGRSRGAAGSLRDGRP